MNKNVFTFSEHGSKEYSASIVRVGNFILSKVLTFLPKQL